MQRRARALMTDLYELTMAAGYFENHVHPLASFELFVRDIPRNRNYLLAAGLAQVLDYLAELRFSDDEIEFLRRQPVFRHVSDDFFEYLKRFRFTGDVWAMPEGTPFFSNEPILRVTAPLIEAQILETYVLSAINFQTTIASKAARIVEAAQGRPVIEFGARRAHTMDAALYGARAAYIGGCAGTSNVEAGCLFGIPIFGTMAHSWMMVFPSEMEAFDAYYRVFPDSTTLLIDTYDTLAGARHATRLGPVIRAIRLDSGDIVQLSQQVRRILNEAGMQQTRIMVSSELDEYRITELLAAGAPIDLFGVGTHLSVSYDAPTLGGVYKLVEMNLDGRVHYRMKLSADKTTLPGRKQVWRTMDDTGQFLYDTIGLMDEPAPAGACPLLRQYMTAGRICQPYPTLAEIQQTARDNLLRLPAACRAIGEAPPYPVQISPALDALSQHLASSLISTHNES